MGRHALLSASSSHRWLACPPSARLCENYEDTGSEYAQQGTDAHSLCEHKLKLSLGMETEDPTEGLSFYDEEMEECACGYADYVLLVLCQKKVQVKRELHLNILNYTVSISSFLNSFQYFFSYSFGDS